MNREIKLEAINLLTKKDGLKIFFLKKIKTLKV